MGSFYSSLFYFYSELFHEEHHEPQRDTKMKELSTEELAKMVIGAAIEVHRELGPGLLESAYQACLIKELEEIGLTVKSEVSLPIVYKGLKLDHGYRIDILVEDKLVLELKAVEALTDVHIAQMLTYLKLGDHRLGLLLNFHVKLMKQGIKRVIL